MDLFAVPDLMLLELWEYYFFSDLISTVFVNTVGSSLLRLGHARISTFTARYKIPMTTGLHEICDFRSKNTQQQCQTHVKTGKMATWGRPNVLVMANWSRMLFFYIYFIY